MAENTDPGQVTEEQAGEALQQLLKLDEGSETQEASPVEETPVEAVEVDAGQEEASVEEESDDLESLKQRLSDIEEARTKDEERYQERVDALKTRSESNEGILRDRYLRKSTVADKALKALKASRTEDGVGELEVDQLIREMEGTMNPESASYAPPPQEQASLTSDGELILNNFLNEKGMTTGEAEEFGVWIRNEAGTAMTPAEQAVGQESVDGFLRLAHMRFTESQNGGKEAKTSDAVEAVKSVQRTQREAARAASSASAAPKKQPAQPKTTTDLSKLTNDDISGLLRQAVEQGKR